MTALHTDTAHEQHAGPADLAYRTSGRYEIVLFLDTASRELSVTLLDEITGVTYDLPVRADEALEVFHHPFAHPAFHGVHFDDDCADDTLLWS